MKQGKEEWDLGLPRPPGQGAAGTPGRPPQSPIHSLPIPQLGTPTRPGIRGGESTGALSRELRRLGPAEDWRAWPGGRRNRGAWWTAQRTPGAGRAPAPLPRCLNPHLPILSGGARSSALPGHPQLHSSSHSPRSDEPSCPAVHPMATGGQQSTPSAPPSAGCL